MTVRPSPKAPRQRQDPNCEDVDGHPAVLVAAAVGSREILEMLLQAPENGGRLGYRFGIFWTGGFAILCVSIVFLLRGGGGLSCWKDEEDMLKQWSYRIVWVRRIKPHN